MNKYRTHNCGELTKKNNKSNVILSGWINKKRDHGNLLFLDLRDNYGITQCLIDKDNEFFKELDLFFKDKFYNLGNASDVIANNAYDILETLRKK